MKRPKIKVNRSRLREIPARGDSQLDATDVRCHHNVYWKACAVCSKPVKR